MGAPIVIVGAGLAGLVCARRLHRSGMPVAVLERSEAFGGRLRTDSVDGFLLDRGFQIVPTGYWGFSHELDVPALRVGAFEPGALVHWQGKLREFLQEDPISLGLSRLAGIPDKIRLATYSAALRREDAQGLFEGEDRTAEDELRRAGFGDGVIDRFFRPFFGGVTLDRSLSGSANFMRFVWKSLSAGPAGIPAGGVRAVAEQVAADLPEGTIRLGIDVSSVSADGVQTVDGGTVEASGVVVATDALSAHHLVGSPAPEYRSSTTVYFAADRRPYDAAAIAVNADLPGVVNHVAVTSAASPTLARRGSHLVAATLLGVPGEDDGALARSVLYEMREWFPGAGSEGWSPLAVYRVPNAQPVHAPGFFARRPRTEHGPGLWLATELCFHASLEGAVLSGRSAAQSVLAQRMRAAS